MAAGIPPDRATWGGLIATYWPLIERIQKRLKNREPVWYPEIEFLVLYVHLLVLSKRAKNTEQRGRLVELTADLEVLAQKAHACRGPRV